MLRLRKNGKLAWDVIAIIVLALIVLVIVTLFAKGVRDKVIEAWKALIGIFTGRAL